MRAETVADLLVERVFMKFGVPNQLHSGQGPIFESRLMSCLCQLLGVCKSRATPYRPQSDGLVERANHTIQVALQAYVEGDQASWDKHLSLVQFAYNTGVHRSTGFTPHFVLFEREARLPLDLFLPPPNTPVEAPLPVYVSNLRSSLGRAFGVVHDHLGVAHRVAKAADDRQTKLPTVKPGDYVWLHAVPPPGSNPKLFRPWQVEVVKGVVCAIVRVGPPPSPRHAKHLTVHVDRLRVVQSKVVVPPGVPATGTATPERPAVASMGGERPAVASMGGPALFLPAPFVRSVPGLVQPPGSLPTPPPSPVVVPPAGAQGSPPLVGSPPGTPAPSPPDSPRLVVRW